MEIRLLSRLFRGKSEAICEDDGIPLVDFRPHTTRTITITPVVRRPELATLDEFPVLAPAPAPQTALEQVKSMVEKSAGTMAEARNGAVHDVHAILAEDHGRLEIAAADVTRIAEELGNVREELAQVRHRLAALERSAVEVHVPRQVWRERLVAQAGVLCALRSQVKAKAARSRG